MKTTKILTIFVLVLSLASAGYGDCKVDFDDTEDPCTEPGYTGFLISDSGSEVNGIIIDLGGAIYDCRRVDPNSNNEFGMPINEEQIHRDFIFGLADSPVNITLWGLGAGQKCDIHIWAFDEEAESRRAANWTANGVYMLTTDFEGGDVLKWPSDWNPGYEHYDFNGIAYADDVGRILLTCTQDPNSDVPFAYVNALEVVTYGIPNSVVKAHRPVPFDGSEDVPIDATLSWIPGAGAISHNVYIGTDPCTLVFRGSVAPNSFTLPYFLEMDQIYYWRIDELPGPIQGYIWSFTTSNNYLVDDFESYENSAALRAVWKDYFTQDPPYTCSQVYVEDEEPVRDGNSMRYRFRNDFAPYYSEVRAATADLGIDPNWIGMNVQSLSLWFYGQETNPVSEQMYVELRDGESETAKVPYSGDMNDITEEKWHEWNISVQEFLFDNPALDLTDITKITIGFDEGTHVEGQVFIDDIYLYTTRCVPAERSESFAIVDYAPVGNPDCVVDYLELEVMAHDWLSDVFFGLVHKALGEAQLSFIPGGLVAIGNIGSDGNDGVQITLPKNLVLWHANLFPLEDPNDPLNPIPDGAFINVTSRGVIDGIPDQVISVAHHEDIGAQVATTVDFSALGPNSLTANYYLNGELVLTEPNISLSNTGWLGIRWPDDLELTLKIRWYPPFLIPDAHWTYDDPTTVTTPKGHIIQVDQVSVDAENISVLFGGYSDVSLTAADIPSFILTNEMIELLGSAPFTSIDINGDSKVNFKDFAVMADMWLEEELWP